MRNSSQHKWYKVLDKTELIDIGSVTTVSAGHEEVCLTRTEEGFGAICNQCPHQGGPLGEGFIEELGDGKKYVICPWHGYEYHWKDGEAPGEYDDTAAPFLVEEREDGIYVAVQEKEHEPTRMDQMVDTMIAWGIDTVFGMVGHSNLGLADAFYRRSERGDLNYIGVRHEGAAAFAASGYAKTVFKPAACFSIAGPGSTNLYTGLWDAKVDRVPILALTGQVATQFLGPHNFQEIPTKAAFREVAIWSQVVHVESNPPELIALAIKHAIVQRDVAHLVFPDEVQTMDALDLDQLPPKEGRLADYHIRPVVEECMRAIKLLENADAPAIIAGNGARGYAELILEVAETIDAPVLTTFKAKGTIPETHELATGVLGRSGTPVSSALMGKSDVLLVLGATFSKHTGISTNKKLIQVDIDRMNLGKFHKVDVAIWGEIGETLKILLDHLTYRDRPDRVAYIAKRWKDWRQTKQARASRLDADGRIMNAKIFSELSKVVPREVVLSVDVGNNTYSFGRYFESRFPHDLIMSGYLGSIGFAFPAAMGAAMAKPDSKIIAITGDGGFGQYVMEFTTAVKYNLNITVILLNNSELAKITKEQKNAGVHVFGTSLSNPNFAEFAKNCGGLGIRVVSPEELSNALQRVVNHEGPALLEIISTSDPK